MNEHRLFGGFQQGDQCLHLFRRQVLARRKAEIHMSRAMALRGRDLVVIPAGANMFAPQIDDGLDP